MVDRVEVPTEGEPDMTDHEQAMLEKAGDVEVKQGNLPGDGGKPDYREQEIKDREVPDWVEEKFRNTDNPIEEQAKAYRELQKKLGQPKEEPKEGDKQNKLEIDEVPKEAEGIDFNKFTDELLSQGELSEGSYEELAKAGISKQMADEYIEGQMAKAELFQQKVFSEVGGEDEYAKMIQWARSNYDEAEREAYNDAVNSGDMGKAKMALRALKASYEANYGKDPDSIVSGDKNSSEGFDVFESEAQVTQAMKDPRYDRDPAYREQVMTKLRRSKGVFK